MSNIYLACTKNQWAKMHSAIGEGIYFHNSYRTQRHVLIRYNETSTTLVHAVLLWHLFLCTYVGLISEWVLKV